MTCGVSFCQSGTVLNGMVSGCPLHNLVPGWNSPVYRRKLSRASERLLEISNFPEFTGRTYPTSYETVCTCGLNSRPVTVKDSELGIIEETWEQGLMPPRPPETRTDRTVTVVGSDPAGFSCAQRLNHQDHNVTVSEWADRPGGLLMYDIPNMKLEKSVVQRRLDLTATEGIAFRIGVDASRDVGQEELREQSDAVVLCYGAAQPQDLDIPGRAGVDVQLAVDFLTGVTRALLDGTYYPSAQGKDVVIVRGSGAGDGRVDACIRQSCKSVTQLETMRKTTGARTVKNSWPEWPRVCKVDYDQEEAIAILGYDPRICGTTVSYLLRDAERHSIGVETVLLGSGRKPLTGTGKLLPCQLLLIAVGFLDPRGYVPEAFGLTRTPCSTVQTTEGDYSTNVPGVFAHVQ